MANHRARPVSSRGRCGHGRRVPAVRAADALRADAAGSAPSRMALPRAQSADLRHVHVPADRHQRLLRVHRRRAALSLRAPVRRRREPGHAVRLRQLLRSVVLPQGPVLASGLEHREVLRRSGRADGGIEPGHGAGAESKDHRARLLARRLLLSGAALAGGRRVDLEVDPAARRRAQRCARRRWRLDGRMAEQRRVGVRLGRIRQHLGAHGVLHADPARRPAGDPEGSLRGRADGPRVAVAGVLAHHAAAADAESAWSCSCWR